VSNCSFIKVAKIPEFSTKRAGGKSKNPFFQIFFISFYINIYKFIPSEKYTIFRPNAQVRPTKGDACPVGCAVCYPIGVFFRNALKKVNHKFGGLIMDTGFLPITINQLTNQPIMTNYAKQTQFPKSQNEIKLLFNKGL